MAKTILSTLFQKFFQSEKAGGMLLAFCTAFSMLLTNMGVEEYVGFWNISLGGHSLVHWINDGLMTIFFLLVGLELEREVYIGELSRLRNALFPVFAALGGMLVPAGLYIAINRNGGDTSGAGIPMATDIAFALGALSMLGNRVPASLKVFLTALAVIDDLGAILVIAIFYSASLDLQSFGIAMGILGFLFVLNRLRVFNLLPYLIGGAVMWYFMLSSGIHATLTGVLLAFVIPFGSGDEKSISYKLQDVLHRPVAYVILPIFALANTCILVDAGAIDSLGGAVSMGIIVGLVFGKPLGILLFTGLASTLKIASLPEDLKWTQILGTGALAGIGFTMSIFITLLAFADETLINASKLSVLIASLSAGIIGYVILSVTLPRNRTVTREQERA